MKANRGFTFIELLITLTVLSICFLPLMNMFSVLLVQTNYSSDITTARYLAQEGMEKIKNLNLTVLQLKDLGNIWDPSFKKHPIVIDGQGWRILRELDPQSDPLQIHIKVFKEKDLLDKERKAAPMVELVTLFEDFEWTYLP